jgi:hypothetical protein
MISQKHAGRSIFMRSLNLPIFALALMAVGISLSQHASADQVATTDIAQDYFGSAVPADTLDALRGGEDQYLNDMKLYAQLYDNKALSNVTGNNIVTQDAFAGAQGYATVIQNSGNNVIIQNATILNLRMQ